MKTKISNLILFVTSMFVSTIVNAVELSKVNPKDIIGGKPTISVSKKPTTSASLGSPRTRAVPYKYASQRRVPLVKMYRGSKHEKALDAQIRNYRKSAKENERVFGAPFRKSETRKTVNTNAIFEIIIDAATGKKFYVPVK